MKLVFYKPDLQYINLSLAWTFQNLAKINNLQYEEIPEIDDRGRDLLPCPDKHIFIYFYKAWHNKEYFEEFKKKRPNSYLICIVENTHIYNIDGYPWDYVDVYCDTMSQTLEYIHTISSVKTFYFDWNISQRLIKEILKIKGFIRQFSKDIDFICLCNISPNSTDRNVLFNSIKGNNYSLLYNINEKDINKIIDYYAHSWFTLGTTTTTLGNTGLRDTKGFRDAIGPFCDSLLIYDDYPDVISRLKDAAIIYKYGNIYDIVKIYNKYTKDPNLYKIMLNKQIKYFTENCLDVQFQSLLMGLKY